MGQGLRIFLIILIVLLLMAGIVGAVYYITENRVNVVMRRADSKVMLGDTSDIRHGIEIYNELVHNNVGDTYSAEALYKIGRGYERLSKQDNDMEKIAAAQEKYSQVVSQYPHSEWSQRALIRIANINARRGNFDEAQAQLDHILVTFPNTPLKTDVYNEKGEIYYMEHDFDKALYQFHREENLNDDRAFVGRIKTYVAKDDSESRERAIALAEEFLDYRRLSQHTDEVVDLFLKTTYTYADDLYREGAFIYARKFFKKIIDRFPDTLEGEESLYMMAVSYFDQEYFKTAISYFSKTLNNKLTYKDESAQYGKALSYFRLVDASQSYTKVENLRLAYEEAQKVIDNYPGGKYINKANKLKRSISRYYPPLYESLNAGK